MGAKRPREDYIEPDPRDINIFKEVENYRLQHNKWEADLKKLSYENQVKKIDEIFEIVKDWEVVTLTNFEIFDNTKILANKLDAFNEIRRRFIEFCWYTLRYYVTKRMRSKGYPETEITSDLLPPIVETTDQQNGFILQCRTRGNFSINSLKFINPLKWTFPYPGSIECHIIYNDARDNEVRAINNYEDLQNLLNARIHPDAKYEPPASALHWTALSRLINLLELHYV